MSVKPRLTATAIGSFPHVEANAAIDVIMRSLPDAPNWPQLPRRDLHEQMEIQYSEGLPRVVIDREKARMFIDTTGDYSEEFAAFYETYLAASDPDSASGDCSPLAISEGFSHGIPALEQRLQGIPGKLPFVKVQTTGPCSFALTIVDENKRAIFYNEEFRDVVVKALAMKCRWQIQKFKPFAEKVLCFIDEPILSGFGSSTYVSVNRDDVTGILTEVVASIRADDALAGVHCCGNTDWSLLVDAGVDLINFDAFGYGETVALYSEAMREHLGRGGLLAWGVVPTSIAVRELTTDSLCALFEKHVDRLVDAVRLDRRQVIEQSFITPSCGTGSLEIADAERVFALLAETTTKLRAKHDF